MTLGPSVGGGDVGKLLAPIIEHFGAANLVPAHASLPGFNLHTRHYISNTGLYDVWVMYNEMGKPITTDLIFLPGFHPACFVDVVSGRSLQIARDPSGDKIRDIKLGTFETRMWISPRRDVAASALEWLGVQRNWWAGSATVDRKPLPTPAEDQRFTVDLTSGWTFKPADGLSDDESAALAAKGRQRCGLGKARSGDLESAGPCEYQTRRDAAEVHGAIRLDIGLRGAVRGSIRGSVRRWRTGIP